MPAVRAVLFDLDGVLVDSYRVWLRLMQAAAQRFGAAPVTAAEFESMWGQGVDADAERLAAPIAELEAFYDRHFLDHSSEMVIEPAGPAVFAALREAGLAHAVVTNTPAPLAREILRRAGLAPDALVGGTDVPRPKPAPDMVERACRLLGTAPAAALMVGDSSFDRDAAAAAGVRFVGLGIDGDERLESLAELPERLGLGVDSATGGRPRPW